MLVAFRAENVRSFRDGFEFSMLATSLADKTAVRRINWREGGKPIEVLPVAGIFGANASGKTNVLRAIQDMRGHVLHSFQRTTPTDAIPNRPFQLDAESETTPSSFEIDLVLEGVRHQYGFRIDAERVLEEWSYRYPRGRPALLFRRENEAVELGAAERARGRAVTALLRPNALFLSTAATANHPVLLPLYRWFQRHLLFAEAENRSSRQTVTTKLLDEHEHREQALALLRAADLGITGARLRQLDPSMKERLQRAMSILLGGDEDPDAAEDPVVALDDFDVRLTHKATTGDVELHPMEESLGTLVWFGLVGPVVDALANGSLLLADELDASLHPALVEQLVRLFQEPRTNPHGAQLIFNSHDVTLLGTAGTDRLIGRDQIWFTEKRDDGSTRLYSLTDLDPRKDEAVGRRYMAGRYGGSPILSRHEFDWVADLITSGDAS